ncbi:MAG: QueT transporter family protein [Oscillospiraceae bacterium]|nr:QueT transporter family protein [Oscillospiraceae bacterium]
MKKTTSLTINALIAAVYTVLTVGFPVFSFGAVQFRIGEALCLLPAVYPPSIIGVSVGCFLSNILGAAMGANPLGFIDSVVGTAATFISCFILMKLAPKIKNTVLKILLYPLPAVIFNAVFIGGELSFLSMPWSLAAFLSFAGAVALGEAAVCYTLGNLLVFLLKGRIIKR